MSSEESFLDSVESHSEKPPLEAIQWGCSILEEARRKRVYGQFTYHFENGKLTRVQVVRTLKPPIT